MKTIHRCAIFCAFTASVILAAFCFFITADAAPLPTETSSGDTRRYEAVLNNQAASKDQAAVQGGAAPAKNQKVNNKAQEEKNNKKKAASHERCEISSRYPEGIQQWCELITKYAKQHDLSPDLVAAVMLQESGGQAEAYSHSGAVGLMQVMPRDGIAAKFMCANGPCFSSRPSMDELKDPEYNIDYGTRMLAGLNAKYGSIRDALMRYGPMNVGYYYADKVLAIYENYR